MPVIVIVADGARADAFSGPLDGLPALRRLRDEGGGVHEVTSVFPSVTGPAYTPFLMGRFPGAVGVPGLRWYDRARTTCRGPAHARSYVGYEIGKFDSDLDRASPTVFELVPRAVGAMSLGNRGLARENRIGGLTLRSAARAAYTHFSGNVQGWLDVDREVAGEIALRVRATPPDYLFAALTGVDKASHARGHGDPLVQEALGIVDGVVARVREEAEGGGWWETSQLWVVSDHGHTAVHTHDDLADVIRMTGHRTLAHPFAIGPGADVAVMVSGNAMAHVYVGVADSVPARAWWPALAPRWDRLVRSLEARPSVDLVLLPHDERRCEVRSGARGRAFVEASGGRFSYRRLDGDPLALGGDMDGDMAAVHDALAASAYPDSLVQIAALARASRSGDVILSAAPGHDFRSRYEPIPHRSTHGALHRDHITVPLLCSRPPARKPRRTTDVFASTLATLGIRAPAELDGSSFV